MPDMPDLSALLKGAGPWAAFLGLLVLLLVAFIRGWLVSRREYDSMEKLLSKQLAEMAGQRDEYRRLVNAQLEVDQRRIRALDDALEGARVVTQALQATTRGAPSPREIGPAE